MFFQIITSKFTIGGFLYFSSYHTTIYSRNDSQTRPNLYLHLEVRCQVIGGVLARAMMDRRHKIYGILICILVLDKRIRGTIMHTHFRLPHHSVEDIVSPLTVRVRHRMLRMPCDVYIELCKVVQNSSGVTGPVQDRIKLDVYATLRWLARASYLYIATSTSLPVETLYRRIDATITLIYRALPLCFLHKENEKMIQNSNGFARGKSPLTGCIGASDGLEIKIDEPSTFDVPNPSVYFNLKGFFALNMQAVCDHHLRFLFVSMGPPGSSHDSMVYKLSSLSELIERDNNSLPNGMWSTADAA